AAIGMWSFVINVVQTGSIFGNGGSPANIGSAGEQPLHPSAWANGIDVVYELLDNWPLTDHLIHLFLVAGVIASAVAAVLYAAHRPDLRRALAGAGLVAVPFLAPVFMSWGANVIETLSR